MRNLKGKLCLSLINVVSGFLIFFFSPVALSLAFNTTKGAGNNPDGELFIPFGWSIIMFVPIALFATNTILLRKFSLRKKFILFVILCFLIGAIAAIIITNIQSTMSYADIIQEVVR